MTAAILAIFVLSGAAGLIYEVVWARQLVLVFGNTTQAVSAILTGFFGGMAIGSWLGGRIADRVRRPLRMYGLLELALVFIVIATPYTFRLVQEAYRGAFGALETSPNALALVRFGLALLALGPATLFMGATLPTLTRFLSREQHLSRAFGRLYAANTVGAILGTGLSGFVLIELLGLTGTLVVGAVCSGTAGIAALLLERRRARQEAEVDVLARSTMERLSSHSDPPMSGTLPPSAGQPPRPAVLDALRIDGAGAMARPRLAIAIAFVSGLTTLAYQVLWTRLLAEGTGNSTYVFSMILTLFLVGLAIGAVIFASIRNRMRNVVGLIAFAQLAAAALAVVGMAVIAANTSSPLGLEATFTRLLTDFALPALIVVVPTTILLGIVFPATSALVSGEAGRSGSHAGRLLAANTLGAIVGTFVLPFFVIPAIGSPATLGLVAVFNTLTGLALTRWVPAGAGRRGPAALAVLVAVVLVGAVSTGNVFVDPSAFRIERAGGTVYASTEDEIASVQAGDFVQKQLWVTGASMTVLTVDAHLMPILPLMLRPQSHTALVVAFGMGTAFRTALVAGLTTDAVELVPSVPDMFHWFYDDAAAVLANPRAACSSPTAATTSS